MNWTDAVDIYCERLAPGFWAEPVNALSNAAFLAAAVWAAGSARRRGLTDPALWVLICLAALIGVGSFLFHTFANRWSELADVVPIWTFVALYILMSIRWLGGVAPGRVVWIGALVAAAVVVVVLAIGEGNPPEPNAAPPAPDPLNGSGQYAPALLALLAFSVVTALRHHPYRWWVWLATGTFLLSLTFRTIDRDICTSLPLGTHFLWHILNGVMIAALLQLLLRTMTDQRAAARAAKTHT